MSLQPLPPQIQDILRRATRTQYVVLPAQVQPGGDDENQEFEIIQQFFSTPISSIPPLLPIPHLSVLSEEPKQPEQPEQPQQTQETQQTQTNQQSNKITKWQALNLRLGLGFVASLLFVLGLLTAISSDYLDQITSSIKEIFQKKD
jgi:hypothetical protein